VDWKGSLLFCKTCCQPRPWKEKHLFAAWGGRRPLLKKLKDFGCVCYVLIPNTKRGKLGKNLHFFGV